MSGKLRPIVAALLFCSIAIAISLAASPQLHTWWHKSDAANHECAATLISSGSVEHAAGEPIATQPTRAPHVVTFRMPGHPRFLARLGFSLLEHAPPALS